MPKHPSSLNSSTPEAWHTCCSQTPRLWAVGRPEASVGTLGPRGALARLSGTWGVLGFPPFRVAHSELGILEASFPSAGPCPPSRCLPSPTHPYTPHSRPEQVPYMNSCHPSAPQRATPPAPGFHLGRCLASLRSVAPSVQRVFFPNTSTAGSLPLYGFPQPLSSPAPAALLPRPTAHRLCPPPLAAWALGPHRAGALMLGPSDSHCSFCLEHDQAISACPSGRFLLAGAWLRRPPLSGSQRLETWAATPPCPAWAFMECGSPTAWPQFRRPCMDTSEPPPPPRPRHGAAWGLARSRPPPQPREAGAGSRLGMLCMLCVS